MPMRAPLCEREGGRHPRIHHYHACVGLPIHNKLAAFASFSIRFKPDAQQRDLFTTRVAVFFLRDRQPLCSN
jgi:hypothetical protein